MLDTPKLMDAERHFSSAVAILCLFNVPGQSTDWHWKKIAGVPFILRNILSLQRGGIGRLLVYAKKPGEIDERRLRDISSDSRVQLKLEWIFAAKQLAESAQGDGAILICDGSALHSPTEVIAALQDARTPRGTAKGAPFIFPLQDKALNRFLEDIDNFSSTAFEKILREDANSDFVGQRRKLVFLPGSKETLIARDEDFVVQHELLLKTCGVNSNSCMGRWVTSFMLRRLTRLFLRTPLTPHLIMLLGFTLGLWSAWFFYPGNYWAGILGASILQISAWIDSAGGEVARLEFMESKAGSHLNLIGNNIVYAAVFFSIGMGTYTATGMATYQLLGGLAVLGCLNAFLLGSIGKHTTQSSRHRSLMGKVVPNDFTYLLLFMALINQLGMFIIIAAIGTNLLAGFLLYAKIRPSLIPVKSDAEE